MYLTKRERRTPAADLGKPQTWRSTSRIMWPITTTSPIYTKLGTQKTMTPPAGTGTFTDFTGIADIVAINGKPAKGTWLIRSTTTTLAPNPAPGNAIADTTRNFVDWMWDIQVAAGNAVGAIIASGFGFGAPPPGAVPGFSKTAGGAIAITGGTGRISEYAGKRGSREFQLPGALHPRPKTRRCVACSEVANERSSCK